LAKYQYTMRLDGLTKINWDVAKELGEGKLRDLGLEGLTSINKDIAQDLAKFKGRALFLNLYPPSIDKAVIKILKSNPRIKSGGFRKTKP